MIAFLQPLPIGNAVKVLLSPLDGAEETRVLRKMTDDISGPEDDSAGLVHQSSGNYFIDVQTLVNGQAYHYRAFDLVDGVWVASGPSASATPAATAALRGPDSLELVRSRLEAALKVEVAANRIKHETGGIPCFTAPPQHDNVKWPVVTVHLRSDAPAYRGLGEIIAEDEYDEDTGAWTSSEGWLARISIEIIGWSLNADMRIALRKMIKKAVMGNLAVFSDAGMCEVEISQSDVEDFETYNAPVYQTVCTLTCVVPALVEETDGSIAEVTVDMLAD